MAMHTHLTSLYVQCPPLLADSLTRIQLTFYRLQKKKALPSPKTRSILHTLNGLLPSGIK